MRSILARIPDAFVRHLRSDKPQRVNKVDRAATKDTVITVSDNIKQCIGQWIRYPKRFQHENMSILPTQQQTTAPMDPLSQLALWFLSLANIERGLDINRIRRRFYYLIFYLLKKRCQDDGFAHDAVVMLTQMIMISGLVPLAEDKIQKSLRTWVEGGERYQLLSNDLGGPGVLFLLPDDMGEQMYV